MADYVVAGTIAAARYGEQYILGWNQDNVDNASNTFSMRLPAGFGNAVFLEGHLRVTGIVGSSIYSTTEPRPAVSLTVAAETNGALRDFIDVGRLLMWMNTGTFGFGAKFSPDQPVLITATQEYLFMEAPQFDTSATDVADVFFWARVRRLREGVAAG